MKTPQPHRVFPSRTSRFVVTTVVGLALVVAVPSGAGATQINDPSSAFTTVGGAELEQPTDTQPISDGERGGANWSAVGAGGAALSLLAIGLAGLSTGRRSD